MIASLLTGMFKDFLYITIIIIIHELGHIIMSLYFDFKIDKVKILPFGGMTIFKEDINRPLKEELLILIMGPLSQIFLFLFTKNIINDASYNYYQIIILLFNLLPIVPLDGSKLINIISNYHFSFLNSYKITNLISIIMLILVLVSLSFIKFNIMLYLIIFFLLISILKSIKLEELVFNRFLLERYYKSFFFAKNKIIKNGSIKKMSRDKYHLFYIKNKCYSEKEILRKRFDFHGKV